MFRARSVEGGLRENGLLNRYQRSQSVVPLWRDSYLAPISPATDEEREWFLAHRGLFIDSARRVVGKAKFDTDDLLSFAFPFAIRAYRDHDPERGASKETLACVYIHRFLIDKWHGRRGRFFGAGKRKPCNPLLFGGRCQIEMSESPPEQDISDVLAVVGEVFKELPAREQKILSQWLGLNGPAVSIATLGNRRGLSRQRISQITRAALARIAAAIGVKEVGYNRPNRLQIQERESAA